jgi:putative transposase
MGRPLRIEIPGGMYHLMSRGSNREQIYWKDDDRWLFLRLLGIVSVKYAWTVLAYCLMTNHYHLVIQIADGGLSAGMQWLNGTHSRITNQRSRRSAHLFATASGRVWPNPTLTCSRPAATWS